MKKVKIDLSKTVPIPRKELRWSISPQSDDQGHDYITLTHGEVRDDIPDNVISDLVAIGYAVEVVSRPIKEAEPKPISKPQPPQGRILKESQAPPRKKKK